MNNIPTEQVAVARAKVFQYLNLVDAGAVVVECLNGRDHPPAPDHEQLLCDYLQYVYENGCS